MTPGASWEGKLGEDVRAVVVEASGEIGGSADAPPSKSMTNRLLVIAALANGTSRLAAPLLSDDTLAMANCLNALRVAVELSEEEWVVAGGGGTLGPPTGVLEARLSGTTLRFVAGLALLSRGSVRIDCAPALRARPLLPLLQALERAGARVRSDGGHPPLEIECTELCGGRVTVDSRASSQFASALMLVAPFASDDVTLEIAHLGAAGYVSLSAAAMRRAGADVEPRDDAGSCWQIRAGTGYRAIDERVEYDASAAAHLLSLAMATGGEVTVANAVETLQPDARVVELFSAMGGTVSSPREEGGSGLTVSGPGALAPIDADLSSMPDQLPMMAILAALAGGRSRFTGLEVSRGHETDRVTAVAAELAKLGVAVEVDGDELVVQGGRRLSGGRVDPHGDHRMAMALSVLGAAIGSVTIEDPFCVAKTYPAWWQDLSALGVRLAEAGAPPDAAGG